MTHQKGDIVVATVTSHGTSREIIGQVKSAQYDISESGDPDFSYHVADYNVRPADNNEQVEYWKRRALLAEREGHGSIPGKVVPHLASPTAG